VKPLSDDSPQILEVKMSHIMPQTSIV